MTRILTAASFAAVLLAAPAYGADLGHSTKDTPEFHAAPDHGGFAVRVFMGYSFGDREVSQRNSGEIGLRATPDCSNEDAEEQAECTAKVDEFKTDLTQGLNEYGIDASWNGTTFELPLIRALSAIAGEDDVSSISGGAEVEYLAVGNGFAWGLVAGIQLYGDADTTTTYTGAPVKLGGGSLLTPHGSEYVGEEIPGLTTHGYVTAERNFDIDLAVKLGGFVGRDTLIYGIAGPSFAKATIKGGVGFDQAPEIGMLEYEEDQFSIGYVLGVGVQHWFSHDWSLNVQGDYRHHKFDASGKIDETLIGEAGNEVYGKASSSSEVEDSIWTIKAGVAHHW